MKYMIISKISVILGSVSLLSFFHFVIFGSLNIVDFNYNGIEVIIFNSSLLLLFFVQHSIMVRRKIKSYIEKLIPKETFFAMHCICSSILLMLIFSLWQVSHIEIISFNLLLGYAFNSATVISICGLLWAIVSLKGFDPFGRKQIFNHINAIASQKLDFVIKGPYKFTRHPFYFFILLMIWSNPEITLDRLFFNIALTMWVVIGTILEENNLVVDIGDEYVKYQSEVPMLVPYKIIKI